MANKKNNQGVGILIILAVVLWFVFKPDNKSERKTPMQQSNISVATAYESPSNQASIITDPSLTPQSDLTLSTRYVAADKVNVRSSPNGKVVNTLTRGQIITIYHESGELAKITSDNNTAKWVSTKLLCSGDRCYQKNKKVSPSNKKSNHPSPKPKVEAYSGCSCSSGRICIGPRGGRYCITSGGNKRYGV